MKTPLRACRVSSVIKCTSPFPIPCSHEAHRSTRSAQTRTHSRARNPLHSKPRSISACVAVALKIETPPLQPATDLLAPGFTEPPPNQNVNLKDDRGKLRLIVSIHDGH